MSRSSKRQLCYFIAGVLLAMSLMYLILHWSHKAPTPPYGLALIVTATVLILAYAGHQVGIEPPAQVVFADKESLRRLMPQNSVPLPTVDVSDVKRRQLERYVDQQSRIVDRRSRRR